jgi:hypothetical protein
MPGDKCQVTVTIYAPYFSSLQHPAFDIHFCQTYFCFIQVSKCFGNSWVLRPRNKTIIFPTSDIYSHFQLPTSNFPLPTSHFARLALLLLEK